MELWCNKIHKNTVKRFLYGFYAFKVSLNKIKGVDIVMSNTQIKTFISTYKLYIGIMRLSVGLSRVSRGRVPKLLPQPYLTVGDSLGSVEQAFNGFDV